MLFSNKFLLAFVCLPVFAVAALAQTAGVGSITLSGALQGPIYTCGRHACATYDSGQIQVTVNGFTATANYGYVPYEKTTTQLATSLSALLNTSASPVTAKVSNLTINLTSKLTGIASNYPLSVSVTHSSLFTNGSFSAIASGPTLTGGTGPLAPIATLTVQTGNDSSLCSSANDPGGNWNYCLTSFEGFNTNPSDAGVQTSVPDPPAGHVSNLSIKQLMYPGWTGRLLCEYQPWFGLASHQSVGYNENSAATVAAQDSFMIAEGCDINLVDFYGSLSPNQTFNFATANTIFSDLNSRSGYPLKFGIMEDKGALTYSCPTSNQTEAATLTCLETALITDMDFINTNYASSGVYFTDAGQPVIFSFVTKSVWPVLTDADWDTIWSTVKAHTDTYPAPFKYIHQFGSFTTSSYDNGRFAWVQPAAYDPAKQFWWGSNTSSSPVYVDNFYAAALAHPSQLAVAGIWKGFDDNNASWGGNRVIAQQCGQVLLKTAKEISKYYGGTNPQIPYVQVVTWNDYEEGTAVESGIDNCYTVNASLSGSTLSWSLTASDSKYASTSTIHHFTVYYGDASGNLYVAAANLPVSTRSLNLTTRVPAGTWTVYVEMVGQPLIINRMSNTLTFIH
jgi:hypothetical protein